MSINFNYARNILRARAMCCTLKYGYLPGIIQKKREKWKQKRKKSNREIEILLMAFVRWRHRLSISLT